MKKLSLKIVSGMAAVFTALYACFAAPVSISAEKYSASTDFMAGKYGIFLHYLSSMQLGGSAPLSSWNELVNSFDTDAFAKSADEVGASWVCITLTQSDGLYCIPMPELENMIGGSKLSTDRDLVLDLYNSLEPYGIKLMLYWIPGATTGNTAVAKALGAERRVSGELAGGQSNSDYMLNWTVVKNQSSLMSAVSERYGDKISGWWIDGCYDSTGFNERVAEQEAAALKSGNKNAVVAFNNGTKADDCRFEVEDYSAGEICHPNSIAETDIFDYSAEGRWTELGYQKHFLTFLGSNWGTGGTIYETEKLVKHCYENILSKGAALTLDVRVSGDGTIEADQYAQLARLNEYVSSMPEITLDNIVDNRSGSAGAESDTSESSENTEPSQTENITDVSVKNESPGNGSVLRTVIIIAEAAVLAAGMVLITVMLIKRKRAERK